MNDRMKITLLFISLLLGGTTAADVNVEGQVKVEEVNDGIKLSCKGEGFAVFKGNSELDNTHLPYKDENSGEYSCKNADENPVTHKIYVKFRTCDNCIELDAGAAVGILTANLVATFLIGVAVYLTASQSRGPPTTSKKASDRRGLIESNDNSHYQELRAHDTALYSTATRR